MASPATLSPAGELGGAGFEPAKALPSDLQSDPFDRSGNPPSARTFTANIPEPSEFASLSETHCPQTSYNKLTELAEGLEPTTC